MDKSRGEPVELELDRLVEKRHDQRAASEEQRRIENGLAKSTARYNAQRRRELRAAWRAYHEQRAAGQAPYPDLYHRLAAAGIAEGEPTYFRFGDPPPADGRSDKYGGTFETGVSVYRGRLTLEGRCLSDVPMSVRFEIRRLAVREGWFGRGKSSGLGSAAEPLVRRVAEAWPVPPGCVVACDPPSRSLDLWNVRRFGRSLEDVPELRHLFPEEEDDQVGRQRARGYVGRVRQEVPGEAPPGARRRTVPVARPPVRALWAAGPGPRGEGGGVVGIRKREEQHMTEKGKRRKSAFLRVIEERRDAARQQPAAPEETNEREVPDAETPLGSRFLLPSKKRRPYWR
jgi:hypothetical protein